MTRYGALWRLPSAYKTVGSAYLARAVIILCKLFSVPLLLFSLPEEEYAVIVILSGLEAWFLLLDFGIGTALQNTVAERSEEEESTVLRTALIIGSGLILFAGTLLYFLAPFLSEYFLGEMQSKQTALSAFLTGGICFLLNTWGSFAVKVLTAKEQAHRAYVLQSCVHPLALAILFLLSSFDRIGWFPVAICLFGLPALASCLLGVQVFYKVPKIGPFSYKVLRRAFGFWGFSLMAAFVTLSDSLMVTRTLSFSEIIQYNLLCKIFGVASFLYSAFLQVLMPKSSRKLYLGHVEEVEKSVRKYVIFSLIGIVVFTLTVFLGLPYIEILPGIRIDKTAVAFFGLYVSVRIVADFYGGVLQSGNVLKPFFYWVPLQACLSVGFQYVFSSRFGVAGIPAGLAFSYLCTVCWVLPKQLRDLRRLEYG